MLKSKEGHLINETQGSSFKKGIKASRRLSKEKIKVYIEESNLRSKRQCITTKVFDPIVIIKIPQRSSSSYLQSKVARSTLKLKITSYWRGK